MATKKVAFTGPMKKETSNVKSSTNKNPSKGGSTKPMKDCGCGGKHGK